MALNPDGSFTYTPPSNSFTGKAIFTYKAYDTCILAAQCSQYSTDTVTATINVLKNNP